MTLLWHDAAVQELEDAALYYGGIEEALGQKFTAAAEAAVMWIRSHPEGSHPFSGAARKFRLERFPYALVYEFDYDLIRILAVMHLHREPGYWMHRAE